MRARDEALAALQNCAVFEPGVVLALRAELAPPECADVIVGEALAPDVDLDASDPRALALLLRNGLPRAIRADLDSRPIGPEANFVLAWGLVRFGQTYWSSGEFFAAEKVLQRGATTPESELLLGIVRALKAGPRDAVEMMARGSAPIPVTSLVTLDTLAQSQGPWAAAAAFDAAYILELWPPQGDPTFWQSLARRYGHAETVLTNASDKARAKELASAARATAKTLLPASQR